MLEYATTEELWDELAKRQECCVFILTAKGKLKDEIYDDIFWRGSYAQTIGLLNYAGLELQNRISNMISEREP